MIRRLLIANRGEIACRIARTAHAMGIKTVAVSSSAETDSRHVRAADHAVMIGPAAASESYLAIDKIIAAANASGADAIHPGYGFLAENAAFARAVTEAGLTFVGPSAEVISSLGSKLRAAEVAKESGIEPIPRFALGEVPSRFPVMVKAADGGGGKGMAIVRSAEELGPAIESATRIAKAAFGSTDLIVEEYLEGARHIEVQILADSRGNVVHLGERECSIQRRHQKVVEEAPAVRLPAEIREKMTAGAVALATSVGYQSAGTVEMILAPDGRFFFLEVNTRLQVEHAVTEMTTGIDIVREQIRIASGLPLSFAQSDVTFSGAAIEARIYAEDPASGDLPATGTVLVLHEPRGDGIRVDSGLSVGQHIGIEYDPMLAKVVALGSDRDEALRRLDRALAELRVVGVATNRGALRRLFTLAPFASGALDTELWSRHRDEISAAADPKTAAIASTLAGVISRVGTREHLALLPAGFRLGGTKMANETVHIADAVIDVRYRDLGGDRFEVGVGDDELTETVVATLDGNELVLWRDGMRSRHHVASQDETTFVSTAEFDGVVTREPRFGDPKGSRGSDTCVAPMPGRVATVNVAVGDRVEAGDILLVLEAMKMEHPVLAPHAGEVTEIAANADSQVDADQVLVVVSADENSADDAAP